MTELSFERDLYKEFDSFKAILFEMSGYKTLITAMFWGAFFYKEMPTFMMIKEYEGNIMELYKEKYKQVKEENPVTDEQLTVMLKFFYGESMVPNMSILARTLPITIQIVNMYMLAKGERDFFEYPKEDIQQTKLICFIMNEMLSEG